MPALCQWAGGGEGEMEITNSIKFCDRKIGGNDQIWGEVGGGRRAN